MNSGLKELSRTEVERAADLLPKEAVSGLNLQSWFHHLMLAFSFSVASCFFPVFSGSQQICSMLQPAQLSAIWCSHHTLFGESMYPAMVWKVEVLFKGTVSEAFESHCWVAVSSKQLCGWSIEAVCCGCLASVPSLSVRAWQVVCCRAALQPAAPVTAGARAYSVLGQDTVCLCCPL